MGRLVKVQEPFMRFCHSPISKPPSVAGAEPKRGGKRDGHLAQRWKRTNGVLFQAQNLATATSAFWKKRNI